MAYVYSPSFQLDLFVITLLCTMLLQIGTNFANDYLDFLKGADNSKRKGPARMVQQGYISVNAMKYATFISFASAFFIGLYLVYRSDLWILLVGILSIAGGFFYTAGSRPLAYRGLGDIMALVFFGPVAVGGSYYIHTLSLSMPVFLLGIGMGLLSTALLTVNNLRDVDEDKEAGKQTLIVLFGSTFGYSEYCLCLVFSSITLLLFCFEDIQALVAVMLFSTYCIFLIYTLFTSEEWIKLLEKTALLLVLYPIIVLIRLFL